MGARDPRRPLGECARCFEEERLGRRGLCEPCTTDVRTDGMTPFWPHFRDYDGLLRLGSKAQAQWKKVVRYVVDNGEARTLSDLARVPMSTVEDWKNTGRLPPRRVVAGTVELLAAIARVIDQRDLDTPSFLDLTRTREAFRESPLTSDAPSAKKAPHDGASPRPGNR